MNISGPLSVSPINPVNGQELGLRAFQRVTAQILSVNGSTAILSIDGYPVVAQLSSSDQAADLLMQQTAQFIVTQLTDQVVTLKFVKSEQTQAALTGSISAGPELAVRLLEQNGIQVTDSSLLLARSALKQNLPVTPELMTELLGVLSEYGSWGDAQAELATALKAAGLPLTAQSLALASRQGAQTGEALGNMIALLSNALKQNLPAETLQQLNASLRMLSEMVLQWDGTSNKLAKQMKTSVDILGKSLENLFLEQSQNSGPLSTEKSLLSLVKLQQMLKQDGKNDLADAIGKFLSDIRQNHLMNVKPDPVPGRGQWSEIGFILQRTPQEAIEDFAPARLRIAHESGTEAGKINPAYTRLIIQVDVKPGETIEVDISLVDKQIRTSVTAPDPLWVKNAQVELPSLENALQALGFDLKDAQIGIGYPRAFGGITMTTGGAPRMTVDIEV
ncbi:MAG: hypothetical protein NTW32_10410 [Chloroflexi bacterium]|nr:hypothetical protein [Chloroflexota bacterium]